MSDFNAPHHKHKVPEDGLEEVLRGWSSRARLYDALAGVVDDWAETKWSPRDVRNRADRILFAEIAPMLSTWPTTEAAWLNALPAVSRRRRSVSPNPGPGTDWVATRVQGGWPPDRYIRNERDRTPDQVMATTLRWTIDRVEEIRANAIRVEKTTLENLAEPQIDTLLRLREKRPLDTALSTRPTRPDISSLQRSGPPWTDLAQVADLLIRTDSLDPMEFARRHLLPDDDVRWRLFHLGVLGVLLKNLRLAGWKLRNLRPLSASTESGPNYVAESPDGDEWDIWFESNAMWGHYNKPSPYRTLTAAAFSGTNASPVGADVAILKRGAAAYLLECKYGDRKEVRPKGYHQVTTYVAEALDGLVCRAEGFVVGPDDVIANKASVTMNGSPIHIVGPRHLVGLLPVLPPSPTEPAD